MLIFDIQVINLQYLVQGWNRKGLISDQGYRKKAWYVMKEYYESIK